MSKWKSRVVWSRGVAARITGDAKCIAMVEIVIEIEIEIAIEIAGDIVPMRIPKNTAETNRRKTRFW